MKFKKDFKFMGRLEDLEIRYDLWKQGEGQPLTENELRLLTNFEKSLLQFWEDELKDSIKK